MICRHKWYHLQTQISCFATHEMRWDKSKFVTAQWYNLCLQIIQSQNVLCLKGQLYKNCKRGYFRWRKISQKCWQDISRGGNFHETTPISFINAYGFYFRVGVIFAKKTKMWKRENYPHAKISTFTEVILPMWGYSRTVVWWAVWMWHHIEKKKISKQVQHSPFQKLKKVIYPRLVKNLLLTIVNCDISVAAC